MLRTPKVVLLLYLKSVGAVSEEQLYCLKLRHGSYFSLILDWIVRAASLHSSVLHSGGVGVVVHSSARCEGQSFCDCDGAVLIRKIIGEMTRSEVTIKVAAVNANLWRVVDRLMKMQGAQIQQLITFGACTGR